MTSLPMWIQISDLVAGKNNKLRNFRAQDEGEGVFCELQKQQFLESLARD